MPEKTILLFFVILVVITLTLCPGCVSPGRSAQVTSNPVSQPLTSSEHVAVTGSQAPASGSDTVSTASARPGETTGSQNTVVQTRGVADPAFVVDVMIPEKIAPGTTLVGDLHDPARPRIVEVNMLGEIIWEYDLPEELKEYTNPGFSAVPLQNGNILAAYPGNGVYEINRTSKTIVWEYIDRRASHDAERFSNGNTLVVTGGYGRDTLEDPTVVEVDPRGQVVWSWYAKDEFNRVPYNTINNEGWTHANAASRLQNGNILISLRNFNFVVEVDRDGKVVRTVGKGVMTHQHDPEVLPNGNLLFANPGPNPQVVEMDPEEKVAWRYKIPGDIQFSSESTRDADRLQNGNTLITSANRLSEVTQQGEIVWQFRLKDVVYASENDAKSQGFYKAIRIPS